MLLHGYFLESNQQLHISPEQASDFAKRIAGDFNPIHDPDAKRFCVPGDLLFAWTLHKYGCSEHMHFQFDAMLGKQQALCFPETVADQWRYADQQGKSLLRIQKQGQTNVDPVQIDRFSQSYVSFSGRNFIEILVPLMREHQVMINPARPLVIYEQMQFELSQLTFQAPKLQFIKAQFDIDGKRGDLWLHFDIFDQGNCIGQGQKKMVLSGLREYVAQDVQSMVNRYNEAKHNFLTPAV